MRAGTQTLGSHRPGRVRMLASGWCRCLGLPCCNGLALLSWGSPAGRSPTTSLGCGLPHSRCAGIGHCCSIYWRWARFIAVWSAMPALGHGMFASNTECASPPAHSPFRPPAVGSTVGTSLKEGRGAINRIHSFLPKMRFFGRQRDNSISK